MSGNNDRYSVHIESDEETRKKVSEIFEAAATREHDRSGSASRNWYDQTPQQMAERKYNGDIFNSASNGGADNTLKKQ